MTVAASDDKDAEKHDEDEDGELSAPDGGWGWMVTFASFFVSFFIDGIGFSFGLFMDEFKDYFHGNQGKTSLILSVFVGCYLIFGPVISALVNIFGCRPVALIGAFIASTGLFLSTFSPNLDVMIFLYGFVGGTGFGLLYLPAFIMVSIYFNKRRALATGITCCGSGIGGFVFAPLGVYLLEKFGWQGAMWIIAAMSFHCFAFSFFYRPLERGKRKVKVEHEEDSVLEVPLLPSGEKGEIIEAIEIEDRPCDQFLRPGGIPQKHGSESLLPRQKSLEAEDVISYNGDLYRCKSVEIHFSPLDINFATRLAYSHDLTQLQREENSRDQKQLDFIRPLEKKDLFYSGSLRHLKSKSAHDLDRHNDVRASPPISDKDKEDDSLEDSSRYKQFMKSLSESFDFTLLWSPTFVVYGISCFLVMFGFFTPFTYLPKVCEAYGMGIKEGALLIAIIGITNTVGRILVGLVSDQTWADCLLINNLALIVGGVSTVFVPFYNQLWMLGIYAVVFGVAIAAFISLRSIIMVELLGLRRLTSSFGLVVLCQGASCLLGPPVTGTMYDVTGSFMVPFFVSGITLGCSGLMCLPLRRISEWEKKHLKECCRR